MSVLPLPKDALENADVAAGRRVSVEMDSHTIHENEVDLAWAIFQDFLEEHETKTQKKGSATL